MKKLIITLVLFLLASPCFAGPMIFMQAGASAAAPICQAGTGDQWTDIVTDDFWEITDNNYQYVAVASGSYEICKVVINLRSAGTTYDRVSAKICDTTNCSTGCNSAVTVTLDSISSKDYTFDFSGGTSTRSADFKVCFIRLYDSSADVVYVNVSADPKYFGASTANQNVRAGGTDRADDANMTIWYKQ